MRREGRGLFQSSRPLEEIDLNRRYSRERMGPTAPLKEKMIMKGQKRKLPPEDSDYTEKTTAEIVLYISLNKYHQGQELAEPSLRRSVLIANTLRQISLEAAAMEKDGGSPTPCGAGAALQSKENGCTGTATPDRHLSVHGSQSAAASDLSSFRDPQRDVASSTNQAGFHASAPDVCIGGDSEDWESMSSDPDFSLSAAISSILTSLESSIDGNNGGSPATLRTPLRSLENLATPEGEGSSKQQAVRGPGWGCWERADESRATDGCVEVMRSSYLGDLALDDLFQDIDTSLLERELGVLGARAEGHPSGEELLRYLPSLSSTAPSSLAFSSSSSPFLSFNQNLWCLPSFSSFNTSTAPSSFSSPSLSSSPFPGQGPARDLLELDHVMEVLVES